MHTGVGWPLFLFRIFLKSHSPRKGSPVGFFDAGVFLAIVEPAKFHFRNFRKIILEFFRIFFSNF